MLSKIIHDLPKEELIEFKEHFDNDFVPLMSTIININSYELSSNVMEVFRAFDSLIQHLINNNKRD